MTPKERVRANIYKTLLEEEKRKNKRMSIFSVGLFFVGIVTMSTYHNIVNSISSNTRGYSSLVALNKTNEDALISSLYNNSVINKKTVELNPDELFSLNVQI